MFFEGYLIEKKVIKRKKFLFFLFNYFFNSLIMLLYCRISVSGGIEVASKQIYAALEIADHEVRLLVGEFHESHFNVLRVERTPHNGIENLQIVNEAQIVSALTKAVENTSNILGYKIERVLLAVPCVSVKKQTRKVSISIQNQVIQLSDLQRGINQAISIRPEDHLELVNVGGIKYIVNGIGSRKMPLNEACDQLTMELDLFYADKMTLYRYAGAVEKAGLEIMDICLDAYAIGEEAALFEQTIENYIILVNFAYQSTTLSLFSQGKLLTSDVFYSGYGDWVNRVKNATGIKTELASRLVCENVTFDESKYSDQPIFLWADKGEEKTLSSAQLHDMIMPCATAWVEKVKKAIAPIQEAGKVKVVITGEGCEIRGVKKLIDKLECDASIYIPQIIGARNTALTTCLGLFYAWRSINAIRGKNTICTEPLWVEEAIQNARSKNNEESGFTKKLVKIIMNDK